ncbi:MAG: tetratricopeptide (TPR) repeat protein [Pseudohongiellaceae bacterium]|jgi:tetratricopeptide (TPR) repeat protein
MLTKTLAFLALGTALACGPGSAPGASDPAEAPTTVATSEPSSVDDATFETTRNKAFQLQEASGELPAVREALLLAHAMRPQAFGINKRLGAINAELRLNMPAIEHYRMALRAHEDDNSVRQSLVALLAMVEADDEMLRELPRLRADPAYEGEALFLEARLRDMRGDRDSAEALLREASGLPPAEVYRALSLHGRFVFQSGDYTRAQALFQAAQKGRPDYKEAVKGLADCARRLGQDEAGEHWGAVLKLLLELTDDEYIKKDDDSRRERLAALLALMPEYTSGFKLLADIYRRNDQTAEACSVIKQFIELHGALLEPGDIDALRARYCQDRKKTRQ